MVEFARMRRAYVTLWGLVLAAFAAADAQGAPIKFSITDLGQLTGTGLDNDGKMIAQPIRNTGRAFDPRSHGYLGGSWSVVDGTKDGLLLVNGYGEFDSPLRHTYETYVYHPGDGPGSFSRFSTWLGLGNYDWATRAAGIDMNASGDVVGRIGLSDLLIRPEGQQTHLFFAAADSNTMQDLNDLIPPDSGWRLADVFSINDRDQILGGGYDPEGEFRALLLTPEGLPVPEPGAWAVFGLAAAGFAWRRRRV